jgi:hypothetical protein
MSPNTWYGTMSRPKICGRRVSARELVRVQSTHGAERVVSVHHAPVDFVLELVEFDVRPERLREPRACLLVDTEDVRCPRVSRSVVRCREVAHRAARRPSRPPGSASA